MLNTPIYKYTYITYIYIYTVHNIYKAGHFSKLFLVQKISGDMDHRLFLYGVKNEMFHESGQISIIPKPELRPFLFV